MNLDVTSLRNLLKHSLALMNEKSVERGIRLTAQVGSAPETIRVDERKIKQVIFNLLSNALKFTPEGGAVTVTAGQVSLVHGPLTGDGGNAVSVPAPDPERPLINGDYVEISVADSGIGIAPEDLERIFDPFEQADNSTSRRYAGTGLGLSLTRKLVELHGGRIWAESEGAGRGSCFRFILPEGRGPEQARAARGPM